MWASEGLGLGEGALMDSSVGAGLGASLGGSASAAERRGGSSAGAMALLSSSRVGICPGGGSEYLVSGAGEEGLLSSWLTVSWV